MDQSDVCAYAGFPLCQWGCDYMRTVIRYRTLYAQVRNICLILATPGQYDDRAYQRHY